MSQITQNHLVSSLDTCLGLCVELVRALGPWPPLLLRRRLIDHLRVFLRSSMSPISQLLWGAKQTVVQVSQRQDDRASGRCLVLIICEHEEGHHCQEVKQTRS